MTDSQQDPGLILGFTFIAGNIDPNAWRESNRRIDKESLDYHIEIARLAERSGAQLLFFGDGVRGADEHAPGWQPTLDPIALSSALAAVTSEVGFVISASSVVNDPFLLTRALLSVDHLSRGRVGWNILTSFYPELVASSYTVGRKVRYEDRYVYSQEFIDIVRSLSTSWEPDAIVRDPAANRYVRPGGITPIDYRGDFLQVAGAPNVSRSPQGEIPRFLPVGSARGEQFAVANAEVIFTRQYELTEARAFAERIRARAQESGRDPGSLRITPGLVVVLGEDERDALARLDRVTRHVDADEAVRRAQELLGWQGLPIDPQAAGVQHERSAAASAEAQALYRALAAGQRLSDVARRKAVITRFPFFYGSPEQVADRIEEWYSAQAVDGFVLGPVVVPDGFEEIASLLSPELRRRGLLRPAVAGATLRERLGLASAADAGAGRDAAPTALAESVR